RAIHQLDPDVALFDVHPMTEALGGGNGFFLVRMGAIFSTALGLLGLALAVIGVYGVISYVASRRTHELGLRMALGAAPADILRLVLGGGLFLVVVGLAVGLALALALSRVLANFLFGVSAQDPLTFVTVASALAAIAVIACAIPAWRAARLDPTIALRGE